MNVRIERYNEILGIDKRIDLEELKRIYRIKAKQLHPDRNTTPDSHDQFVLLHEAYEFYNKLLNENASRQEAEMVVPVPPDALLRGFDFQGGASEPTAKLLSREEARRIYESTVAKMRDPCNSSTRLPGTKPLPAPFFRPGIACVSSSTEWSYFYSTSSQEI